MKILCFILLLSTPVLAFSTTKYLLHPYLVKIEIGHWVGKWWVTEENDTFETVIYSTGPESAVLIAEMKYGGRRKCHAYYIGKN